MNATASIRALLVRASGRTCAFELAQVVEVMRPLPIRVVAGAPEVVRGLAVIRGIPLAVVALDKVLLPAEVSSPAAAGPRLVVVRTGARQIALEVDTVLGVYELGNSLTAVMPPLLQHAAGEAIDAIGSLDAALLLLLNASRILPSAIWPAPNGPEG